MGPGSFLEAPRTEKRLERGEGGELRYGLGAMQGWRAHMEDAHTAQPQLPGALAAWAFFAVYDGHAGGTVAQFCARHLLEEVVAGEAFAGEAESPAAVKAAVREGFLRIDRRMQALARAEGWEHAGSTAVAVLVSPRHLYFINLGDSRALLCRAGRLTFHTKDHKPGRPRERERIENAGGTVLLQRVNGSLAVSRALGDFDYKAVAWRGQTEQLVSAEPEVDELARCPGEDEFLVLACDGVWDAFDTQGLCAFVRSRLLLGADPLAVCEEVLDAGLHKVRQGWGAGPPASNGRWLPGRGLAGGWRWGTGHGDFPLWGGASSQTDSHSMGWGWGAGNGTWGLFPLEGTGSRPATGQGLAGLSPVGGAGSHTTPGQGLTGSGGREWDTGPFPSS
uniref:protein-serine/threonine phosphatase n=1 Tax=Chelydra serpentina TaxID=8475 RepID=A0A8C3SAU3_CHESE